MLTGATPTRTNSPLIRDSGGHMMQRLSLMTLAAALVCDGSWANCVSSRSRQPGVPSAACSLMKGCCLTPTDAPQGRDHAMADVRGGTA